MHRACWLREGPAVPTAMAAPPNFTTAPHTTPAVPLAIRTRSSSSTGCTAASPSVVSIAGRHAPWPASGGPPRKEPAVLAGKHSSRVRNTASAASRSAASRSSYTLSSVFLPVTWIAGVEGCCSASPAPVHTDEQLRSGSMGTATCSQYTGQPKRACGKTQTHQAAATFVEAPSLHSPNQPRLLLQPAATKYAHHCPRAQPCCFQVVPPQHGPSPASPAISARVGSSAGLACSLGGAVSPLRAAAGRSV